MAETSTTTDTPGRLRFKDAAADLAGEAIRWLGHLAAERRASSHTLEAYARDLRQFLAFLNAEAEAEVSIADFIAVRPAMIRDFMAARRTSGVESRSLLRALLACAPLPAIWSARAWARPPP